MTSSEGREVKAWEPSYATQLQILFGPLISYFNYPASISNLEPEHHEEQRARLWVEVLYWLPITISGWLIISYPICRRMIKSSVKGRVFAVLSLIMTTLGGGLLTAHLFDWATIYEGYFHMGAGAYFLMLSYIFFGVLVSIDIITKRPNIK